MNLLIQPLGLKSIKEGWLMLGGVLSVLFGIILFAMPGLSLATFLMTTAFFALIAGIMLLMAGFKLRKGDKLLKET